MKPEGIIAEIVKEYRHNADLREFKRLQEKLWPSVTPTVVLSTAQTTSSGVPAATCSQEC